MDRAELERLDRESLVQRAQAAGLKRARVLTRPELIDELLRRGPSAPPEQMRRSRGFFGLARDLLSRVVERGLHLPDAAERFRQALDPSPGSHVPRPEAQAIPTVTLAEIYAAQGHTQRAIETLGRVLSDEPDHVAARALLAKLGGADYVSPREPLPPEPDYEPPPADEDDDEDEDAYEEEEAEAEAEEEDEDEDEVHTSELAASEPPAAEVMDEAAIETPRMDAEADAAEPEPVSEPEPEPELELEPVPSVREPLTVALPIVGDVGSLGEDRCIAVGPYVWWQLSASSQRLAEEAFFFLRVVTIVPTWDGPKVTTRDVAVDPRAGEHVLRDWPRNAVVRIAVGFMVDGEVVPVAHSPALELDPDGAVREWSFDDATPSLLGDPLVALAAERARTQL